MSATGGIRVGIIGCGLIGCKRAEALRQQDELIGTTDVAHERATALAERHGGRAYAHLDDLLAAGPDAVVVAATHDQLAPLA